MIKTFVFDFENVHLFHKPNITEDEQQVEYGQKNDLDHSGHFISFSDN